MLKYTRNTCKIDVIMAHLQIDMLSEVYITDNINKQRL